MTLASMIPPGEIDFANYSMIPQGDFYEKLRLTRRNLSKIENILTHWSVAQAGSNDEKNGVEIITGLSL